MVEGTAPAGATLPKEGGGGIDAAATAMEGLTSITKGISGVIDGIFQVIGKLFNAIMDASPLLQGMLKIISKMFMLVLMPIGNMIGRLLMPVVIKMANKTMALLSKFGNAGPDQMQDVMAAGMTIALQSMIEMLQVVLKQVLVPLIAGIVQAIGAVLFGGNVEGADTTAASKMISGDLSDLMGAATGGFGDVINQFGLTVQTGNRIAGNSFAESATAFYTGNMDIASGFQATAEILVIGSTKAIKEFSKAFDTSKTELITIIDTLQLPFKNLKQWIDINFPTQTAKVETPSETGGKREMDWGRFLLGALAPALSIGAMLTKPKETSEWFTSGQGTEPETKYTPKAKGGIVTRPTRILAGEAGAEAIIPLSKAGGAVGGNTVNVHFHGDVYGMDDFERKVEKTVNKYGGKVRGAY